jgi:WD40 repeat protein
LWRIAPGQATELVQHRLTPGGSPTGSAAEFRPKVAFSRDSQWVLTVFNSPELRVWNARTGESRWTLRHPDRVNDAAWSPDGSQILTAGRDGWARFWDMASGKEAGARLPHDRPVTHCGFSPLGTRVFTVAGNQAAEVWNASTRLPITPILSHGERSVISAIDASPDGLTLLTAGWDGTARLWNIETGQEIGRFDHRGRVGTASFSPDGRYVVTAGREGTARVWDVKTRRPASGGLPSAAAVLSAAVDPASNLLATAAENGAVRVWRLGPGGLRLSPLPLNESSDIQFSHDGRWALAPGSGRSQGFRVWRIDQSDPGMRVLGLSVPVRDAQFIPGADRVMAVAGDGIVRRWDLGSEPREIEPALRHAAQVSLLVPSRDGRWALVGCADGTARIWNLETGQAVAVIGLGEQVVCGDFDPGGQSVILGTREGTARVWNTRTGGPISPVLLHAGPIRIVRFSPAGGRVVIVEGNPAPTDRIREVVRLRDARSGEPLTAPLACGTSIQSVEFSGDGSRMLTISEDGTVTVWDSLTGDMVSSVRHENSVVFGTFSPDGLCLVTGTDDGAVGFWNPETGRSLCPPLTHPAYRGVVRLQAGFPPRDVLIATKQSVRWLGLLPTAQGSWEHLQLQAEVLSGHRIDPRIGLTPLESNEVQNRWAAWTNRSGRSTVSSSGPGAGSVAPIRPVTATSAVGSAVPR